MRTTQNQNNETLLLKLTEEANLELSYQQAKKFFKKYKRLAREFIAKEQEGDKRNFRLLQETYLMESDLFQRLQNLQNSTDEVTKKAFNQALFDMYRATVISKVTMKGCDLRGISHFKQPEIAMLAKAATALSVDYISKYATQHRTKQAKKEEYTYLLAHYRAESKNRALTRNEVMQLIQLADFNKKPRDLSNLNLTGCDLRGLDLRKTKFDGAILNKITINQFTKFKGSTFSNVKMGELTIEKTNSNGSKQYDVKTNSFSLLNKFKIEYKKEYRKSRHSRIGLFGISVTNFLNRLKTGTSVTTKQSENDAEDVFHILDH